MVASAVGGSAAGLDSTPRPVVYLMGATAAGKSALALEVARCADVELVSVDSAQVYRGLDIGSAKPDAATRAAVPHHLLDLREPTERYSAAEFAADAGGAIAAIHARGKVPLLVGGTMLYFKALHEGLAELPSANPSVRAELDARARAEGWPALHAELTRIDAVTAARLAPTDRQRIQRALEVYLVSGRPLSHVLASPGRSGLAERADLRVLQFAIGPERRGDLDGAISARFDAMLSDGLLAEVAALRALPGVHAGLPALRSVGYRQAFAVLEGLLAPAELRAAGIAATRGLAKRQYTWLRQWQGVSWLRGGPDDVARVVEACAMSH